jgi:HlyD family secretion protein
MRNVVIAILIILVVVFGYISFQAKVRIPLGDEGKTAKLVRGDLTLPINATGEIEAAREIVVKSEASGEIVEILKQGGERVAKDELLIRLDPDEEDRSVARAELDVQLTGARLEEAKLNLEQARTADLRSAQAHLDEVKASLDWTEFRLNKLKNLPDSDRTKDELTQVESLYASQRAQVEAAEASFKRSELAVDRLAQVVVQAEATQGTAQENLKDALRRRNETEIRAPIEGIIALVTREVGEVIQGGKTTFTGGTELALILDASEMIVRAEVDEADIGRILEIAPPWAQPGNDGSVEPPADLETARTMIEHLPRITVEAFREEEFTGLIRRIYPKPTKISNVITYQVDVLILSDNRSKLLPGMRADVSFTSEHVADALLCPNEAIREGANGELGVYLPPTRDGAEDAEPEFVACKIGLSNGTFSVVKEGLEEGTTVYTKMPVIFGKKDKKDR